MTGAMGAERTVKEREGSLSRRRRPDGATIVLSLLDVVPDRICGPGLKPGPEKEIPSGPTVG